MPPVGPFFCSIHSVLFCLLILLCSVEFHYGPLYYLYYILFYFILFYVIIFYFILFYSIQLYSMFASVEVRVVSDPVTQTMPLPVLFFILFHSIFWTSVEA